MREHSRDKGRLEDILKYAQNVELIMEDISDVDLWQTATSDIHPLSEQVKRYLEETDWDEWKKGEAPYTEFDNAVYKQAIESARKMKVKGYAAEDIAEIIGLTAEEIEAL